MKFNCDFCDSSFSEYLELVDHYCLRHDVLFAGPTSLLNTIYTEVSPSSNNCCCVTSTPPSSVWTKRPYTSDSDWFGKRLRLTVAERDCPANRIFEGTVRGSSYANISSKPTRKFFYQTSFISGNLLFAGTCILCGLRFSSLPRNNLSLEFNILNHISAHLHADYPASQPFEQCIPGAIVTSISPIKSDKVSHPYHTVKRDTGLPAFGKNTSERPVATIRPQRR